MIWKSDLERRIRELETITKLQADCIRALHVAHDEFFDAIAEDLGYEGGVGPVFSSYGYHHGVLSPRRLARTTPEPSKVVRKKAPLRK